MLIYIDKTKKLRSDIESLLGSLVGMYAWYSNGDGSPGFKYGMRILGEQNSTVNEDGSISIEEFEYKYADIIKEYNAKNPIWKLEELTLRIEKDRVEKVKLNLN